MNLRVFAASIDGLDEAYREIALQMGAFETEGLEIDTHLEQGCVIINFLASDEFRRTAGPLVHSKEAIEALKLLLEAVNAAGDIALKVVGFLGSAIIGVQSFKLLRQKVALKRIGTDIAREHLQQEELWTELQRINLQRARERSPGRRDDFPLAERTLASLSDPDFLKRALPGIAAMLLPLVTGEASSLAIKDGATNHEAIVTAETLAPLIQQLTAIDQPRRLPPYADLRHRPIAAVAKPEAGTGIVTFDTVQLNRRKSGWSVTINGEERPARMLDKQFLDNVATGEEIVVPNVRYKIAYTKTPLRRSVRLDITKVIERLNDGA